MLFGEGGLQAIDGELKRFLIEGSPAYDIDQANAIPTLVLQDARKCGRKLQQLEEYCCNREEWLAKIVRDIPGCTRDAAKALVLRVFFGGGIAGWKLDHGLEVSEDSEAHECLTMLSLEIKRFVRSWGSSELATDAQAADTCTDAELIAGGKNPLFRRFSITYQHKETCVTLIVKDTLTKNGMATRVLCHDGLIADGGLDRLGRPIDRGIGEVHTLLRICEQAVKEQMGYCAQLELKPLTPKSGGSFEAYVDSRWPVAELLDAPEYDKKLGQVQDCEFAEHLIAAKHGQLFK
mmetsp:Transcript_29619/g.67913  ORF Transcript_29619/g.67913 Transcript_29619/m.67913 type:complete len:292 (-) Transcript_29619:51-926(-)